MDSGNHRDGTERTSVCGGRENQVSAGACGHGSNSTQLPKTMKVQEPGLDNPGSRRGSEINCVVGIAVSEGEPHEQVACAAGRCAKRLQQVFGVVVDAAVAVRAPENPCVKCKDHKVLR